MKTVILAVALSTLALASWSAPSGPPRYRVEVVGGSDPVARMTYGLAMNNLGQVTGYSRFDDPEQFRYGSVFLYGNHTLQQIAPLNEGTSRGFGINDRGDIVGSFGRDGRSVPYLYRDGRVIELDGLAPGWGGEAKAINQAGQVVGAAGNGRAFIYDNGRLRYLSDEPLRSHTANAINDRGVVAGEIFTSCCGFEGFTYSDGQLRHLPTLGGDYSSVLALNNAGDMVGYSWEAGEDGTRQAVLYRGNTITPLTLPGSLLGQANDINEDGLVVGSFFMREGPDTGFLYRDGQTYDLNDLLWGNAGELRHISGAVAINDAGQILVHSRNNTPWQSFRTLVLTPIPEPSAWAMLLAGLGVVGAAARRRQG